MNTLLNMFGFATAVFGSITFWVIWFLLSCVATLTILKRDDCWDNEVEWLTGKRKKLGDDEEAFLSFIVIAFIFIFWWAICIIWVIWQILKLLFWIWKKITVLVFSAVDKITPDIQIKIKNKE